MGPVYVFFLCLLFGVLADGFRLPHIINGRDAKVGEFPWQASIQIFSGDHICGAALVTERWLITSAFCIPFLPLEVVVLGAHDITTRREGKPQVFLIESSVAHPDYESGLSGPNIGLIRLSVPATLDGMYVDTIQPAPADAGSMVGVDCVITGWGLTDKGSGEAANVLQAASTRPINNTACGESLSGLPEVGPDVINDGHICVGGQGEEGGCNADDGGPLVCTLSDGSQVLAGVLAWTEASRCSPQYPSVYTRISQYRQWLKDNSNAEV